MSISEDQKLREVIDSSIKIFTKFSVPIYIETKHKPTPCGTGFFVKRGNDFYLVTAAHVLDETNDHRLYFHATPNSVRYLSGKMVRRKSNGNRHDDHIDIGVIKMNEGMLPPYPEVDKMYMDISYLKSEYLPRSGKHYSFTGFPASKSKVSNFDKSINVTTYTYRSDSISEAEYTDFGVNPNTHIILPLDTKETHMVNGKSINFPKPKGMSGAPVFVLYEDNDGNKSRSFPVVGVAIEHRQQDSVVIATDAKYVLEAIDSAI